MSRRASNPASA